jgi:hypothetical protein
VQIPGPKEPNKPVTQILALHQNEDRHDQHDQGRLEGAKYRLYNGPSNCEHGGVWPCDLDDDRLLL